MAKPIAELANKRVIVALPFATVEDMAKRKLVKSAETATISEVTELVWKALGDAYGLDKPKRATKAGKYSEEFKAVLIKNNFLTEEDKSKNSKILKAHLKYIVAVQTKKVIATNDEKKLMIDSFQE